MASLIDDLLDKYKAESGVMTFTKQCVPVHDLLKSAEDAMSEMAKALDVVIRIDVPKTDLNLCADPDATLRIVINLLANAIKHSPAEKTIYLSALTNGPNVEISVRDEGSGIPAEEQGKIFESFYQASTARTARLSGLGSGLGLAICKSFAQNQGGRVFLKSSSPEGSTFTLVLQKMEQQSSPS
jgi:signal transduction histidine kinase